MRVKDFRRHKCVKFLSMFLMLCILFSMFTTTIFATSSCDGIEFSMDDGVIELHTLQKELKAEPKTFEATLYFPETFSGRGGIIAGNYTSTSVDGFDFEIGTNGHPRLYIIDEGAKLDVVFDKVNVYTGEWLHLAVTWDAASKTAICYINGEAKQTMTMDITASIKNLSELVLGGDNRANNFYYFKGKLRNLSLYENVRTEAEILSDYKNTEVDSSGLIGHWDFADVKATDNILPDKSANKNDFERQVDPDFFSEKEPLKDYAYSFALIGDTQSLNLHNPHNMHYIYDWIADNAIDKNIKFVMQLGDITDKSNTWEYAVAKACMRSLDGKVPYSILRGNHDNIAHYDLHFTQKEYGHTIAGSYDNTMRNVYYKLTVGNIKYLIFALDIGTEEKVLEWAGDVINQHPDYNVIVTTHIYINAKGNLYTDELSNKPTKYNPNEGAMNSDEFWDKFVSKYENIKLVVCGHSTTENIVVNQKTGDKGNIVTQVLVDPQGVDLEHKATGGVGLVAMLYFSEDGSEVQVEYYSTVRQKFYKKENQFSLNVDVVKNSAAAPNANEPAIFSQDVKVLIDNNEITFDEKPYICDGRLLFPMRKVFEALQATVTWDGTSRTATAVKESDSISFVIDSDTIMVNGASKKLDVPAKLVSSKTLVPIRAVSEAFDYKVEWDGENNTVSIFTK